MGALEVVAPPASPAIAAVFGGSGFLGRYIVRRLAAAGYRVRIAVRDPFGAAFLKLCGDPGQIEPFAASVLDPAAVARAVAGASVAINLVGILAEKRAGDFRRVHAVGAENVAKAAASAGVSRLIQVSAIGAAPDSPSLYARSKAEGEAAVRAAFPAATILRPSLVFGPEDRFFNRFGAMAALLPVMPVIAGGSRFQPVYVGDVATAVMAALARPDAAGKIYELGGPEIFTFRELLAWILRVTQRRRLLLPVPMAAAWLQAVVMEHLPGKPLTRDQLKLLARDNVTSDLPGLVELGIAPRSIGQIVPAQLARFCPDGGGVGADRSEL
jgi:uncharacterized protein YbjT (DUF2867 family)